MLVLRGLPNPIPEGEASMSTSLLYHAFGIRGYDYVSTAYEEGRVIFTIRQRPHSYRCSVCGARDVHPHGQPARAFRAVPIGGKPVRAGLAIPRVARAPCGVTRQARPRLAGPARTRARAV